MPVKSISGISITTKVLHSVSYRYLLIADLLSACGVQGIVVLVSKIHTIISSFFSDNT